MIGNDVVFSSHKKTEARVKKGLLKILADSEIPVLCDYDVYQQMSIAWSIKEASFKYCRRYKPVFFYPKSFVIKQLVDVAGTEKTPPENWEFERNGFDGVAHKISIVDTPLERLYCKTIVTNDYIHSIVTDNPENFENMAWGVGIIGSTKYNDQSLGVRKRARNHLLKEAKKPMDTECYFKKDDRQIPILFMEGVESEKAFSFSHDHCYVAYAWCSTSRYES